MPMNNYQISPRNTHQMPADMAAAEEYMRPHEAVASLLDLRSGLDSSNYMRNPDGQIIMPKRIEDVTVIPEKVTELFSRSVKQFQAVRIVFNLQLTRLSWQLLHVFPPFPSISGQGQAAR